MVDRLGVHALDDGNVIDDANTAYSVETQPDGSNRGVLTVTRQGGFQGRQLSVRLMGGDDGGPAVIDRSGGRSALRNFNGDRTPGALETAFSGKAPNAFSEDPFGTVLDGGATGRSALGMPASVVLLLWALAVGGALCRVSRRGSPRPLASRAP